ncbi:heparinase II/III domain-containing protein [Psychrobacter sp.]|uniref:heparinase II/III domain-containing protein n=1 Tax=Psychrobacter sp. TaxID=56811 RepID=UPI00300207BD
MEMAEVIEISNSAIVDISYDGLKVDVKILLKNENEHIECASYLYSNDEVIYKSDYKYNNRHIFYISKKNTINLKIKVFFRDKENHKTKKSKYYPVLIKEELKYSFLSSNLQKVSLKDCEIIASKPEAIQIYEKEGFRPRKDSISHFLTIPIDWSSDPFDDRNWMYQLHAWRMLEPYFNRGNVEDLNYIAKIINDWIYFEKNNTSEWLWYDMSVGLRALKISLYLKYCYEKGVDHQISDLDYFFHEHLRHLSNPKELNSGNHGLFQLHGLKSLVYVLDSCNKDAYSIENIRAYANEQMGKLITSQLGQHGVHTENSPDYHFFTHKRLIKMVNSPWWNDLDAAILNLLKQGELAKAWLVFPNNKCVPIGDSHTGSAISKLPKLESWPHVKFDKYIGAKVDGYAIIRSCATTSVKKSSFLFFQGSFYSHHHKHSDDLSLILQENGINILIDSGKYGYHKDKYREYFLSTRSHNTIEVDEQSTTRSQNYTYGSAISEEPKNINGFWVVKGRVDHKVNQYIHERIIIYKPSEELYVIDVLTNKRRSSVRHVDQWWHFDTNTEVFIEEETVFVKTNKNINVEITSQCSSSETNYYTYKGYESNDALIGWISKSYLQYEPTSTLRISTILDKKTTILTRFILSQKLLVEPTISLIKDKIITKNFSLSSYIND